jgi:predicted GIY-YIG superfamily endonuclease
LKPGYLYIITNEAFPGFVKVGVTEDINSRLHVYQVGDPKRKYKIQFYIFHPDAYTAEKNIKEVMKRFALSRKNEWYEIDLKMAISRLQEQVECDFQ